MAVVYWFRLALLALSLPVQSRAAVNVTTSTSINATSSPVTAASTSLPAPSASAFQIDVVYPIANATYNATNYFPVVLSLQNLRPAVQVGALRTEYLLAPSEYANSNNLRSDQWSIAWSFAITPENIDQFSNADGSPFLLVNAAPADSYFWAGTENATHPVSWNLTIVVSWDDYSCGRSVWENLKFTIQRINPTPIPSIEDFSDVTNVCAQPLLAAQFQTPVTNLCRDLIEVETTSSCVAELNPSAVSSVSSLASYIAYPTGMPTTTAMTSSTSSVTASPLRAQALVTARPHAPLLAAVGILGGLQFCL